MRFARELFVLGCVAGVVTFGGQIVSESFHIDSEFAAIFGLYGNNIALGRWGIALLHGTLLPRAFVPFFTPLLSVALLALAAVVAAFSLDIAPAQRRCLVVLAMACPQFAYQLQFPFQSDCIAFGVLCATGAYAAMMQARTQKRRRGAWAAASVALLAAGVSFYQSILFVPPTLALVAAAGGLGQARVAVRRVVGDIAWVLAAMVASLLVYAVITAAVQHATGIPRAPWMRGMTGWPSLPWDRAVIAALAAIRGKVLGGGFYGNGMYVTTWLAAAIMALRAVRHLPPARTGLVGLAAAAAIAMPFGVVLALGVDQPPRTFLAEPLAFAGIWALALRPLPGRWQAATGAVPAVALLAGCYHVSALAYADSMAFEADRLLGNRIVETMYRADPGFDAHATPVYFLHGFAPPNVWRGGDFDVFGASFFAWDGGNPSRIIAFLKATGIADLHGPAADRTAAIAPQVQALPAWPDPGSVRLIGGVLVVKLGR